jgi:type IV secretory pathway VirB10-like protein
MNTPEPAPQAQPDVSIRARPPSPRRLSRKLLLAGALSFAAIVVFALAAGLSARPDRTSATGQARAAASGPPELVEAAPAHYEIGQFAAPEAEPGPESQIAPELPIAHARAPGAAAVDAAPHPDEIAARAPILFSARGADARADNEGSAHLANRLIPLRSQYEVLAGSVIPAALLTELNSDRPGRVIAQVTAAVRDSVSGAHVLIPQGARLIGTYGADNAHGDRRLMLVWQRLIFPNGSSIDLANMEGADPAGAAGVRDRVDNHLPRLVGASLISAIIGVAANEAEDDEKAGFTRSVGDAAAQEAARAGGRIVDCELSVRPTLRVRAGAPVRVLVTRDIGLAPYRE